MSRTHISIAKRELHELLALAGACGVCVGVCVGVSIVLILQAVS